MEHLVQQLPELTLLIVEHLINDNNNNNNYYNNEKNARVYNEKNEIDHVGITSALSFAKSCRGGEVLVEYAFKRKCNNLLTKSFRGWKDINVDDSSLRWSKIYLEAMKVRETLLLSWSFHSYTPDVCQKVFDQSLSKCHGIRTFTEITDGQFGKAMRLPLPIEGSLHQMKGSQVHGQLTTLPAPVDQFTMSTWIFINKCETSPLISLLFTPKAVASQKTMMLQGQAFIVLNISSTGSLFFGRNNTSNHSLQLGVWHHLVVTGNSKGLQVFAWDKSQETKEYKEVLKVNQSCVPNMEKMMVMVGNGKKGDYVIEEMSVLKWKMEKDNFWWLREGLPFL